MNFIRYVIFNWEPLTPNDIINILALLAAIIAAVISVHLILKQLKQNELTIKENIRATKLQALLYIISDLSTDDSRMKRKFVLKKLKNKSWKDLEEKDKLILTSVWASFDQLALLVDSDYLDKELVVNMWGGSIKSCYEKSKTQLSQMRNERIVELKDTLKEKRAKRYMHYFEKLAESI